jgi:hypothetical protein
MAARVRKLEASKAKRATKRELWFAKTSAGTKNRTVLSRVGLNAILASTQREDFGGEEPVCACSAHIYKDGRKVDPN